MTNLLFQRNIFHENDDEHINIIKKYFHVHEVSPNHITTYDSEGQHFSYRTSIAVAKRNKVFEKFTNALEWAGKLRKEMVCDHFQFQTLDYIVEHFNNYFDLYQNKCSELFVRPVAGDKVFAGDVFTEKSLKNEYYFLRQKNADPHTLCMVSFPETIKKEYRLIFIDNNYISGSQYMDSGELSVSPVVPEQVVEYGKQIHAKYDLPPWVVLDIGIVYDGIPRVIELNQIETSSFYAADLDKIYKIWTDYYK